MIALDGGADRGAGLVECLELLGPDEPTLERAEAALDEGLALGVAVAAAAVGDAVLGGGEHGTRVR